MSHTKPIGRLQIFSIGYDNNLHTMWQVSTDPQGAWSDSTSLGNAGPNFNVPLAVSVGYLPDQRMQIFVAGWGENVYTMWKETTDSSSAWSELTSLGNPGGSFDDETTRSVGIGYLPDGRMQIFIIDHNGNVFSRHKETTDPNSAWSNWENLGGPSHFASWGGSYGGSVAVGKLPDGRMQIFTVSYDSATSTGVTIYTIWKETTSPNSAWAKWATLGSLVGLDPIYPTYAGDVAVGYLPDGRMQIFVCTNVNENGTIYTMYKLTKNPDSAWSGLTSLGGPGVLILNSHQGMGPFLSVGYLPDQRMQIFVVGDDGNFYTSWKETTDPDSAWSKWTGFGTPGSNLFSNFQSSIGVGYVSDQRMRIFVVGSDGNFYTRWKETTDPSSAWSSWTKLGNAGPGYNTIAQSWSGVSVGYLV